MSDQEVLQFIHTQLSKLFTVERMILFGSRAKGTATKDSDYDVLVVMDSDLPYYARQGFVGNAIGSPRAHSEGSGRNLQTFWFNYVHS